MKYLVTGGAGYLGSHLVAQLVSSGHDVIVVDDLSHGSKSRLPESVDLIVGGVNDAWTRKEILKRGEIDGLFHLAARKSISESVADPDLYFKVNTQGTAEMLELCSEMGIKNVVFTSSAAVYGTLDKDVPILESDITETINAYGESKLLAEELSRKFGEMEGRSAIALRCFNIAGADSAAYFDFECENVIPIILRRLNDSGVFHKFGKNLSTPDGSCVRDYIHVGDVARAHHETMKAIELGLVSGFDIFNISSGVGTSLDVLLEQLQDVSGIQMNIVNEDLRPGETVSLVGDNSKARRVLDWLPSGSVEQIVADSWKANISRGSVG